MSTKQQFGLHEEFSRDEEVARPTIRNFGLTFTIVFTLLGAMTLFYDDRNLWGWAWLIAAGVILLLTFFLPRTLEPVNELWLRFANLLHKIVSPVILILLYGVSIIPVGIMMKLFRRDPLSRNIDRNAASYWVDRRGRSQSLRDQF